MWIHLISVAAAQVFSPTPDTALNLGSPNSYPYHAAGDVTGDGFGDVVWVSNGALGISEGQSGGAPPSIGTRIPLGGLSTPSALLGVADLDLDGHSDVVSYVSTGTFRGWSGATVTTAGPSWTLDSPLGIIAEIGDVNGDGGGDLAIGGYVWLSSAGGPVAGPVLPFVERLFDVGDVNGDGFDDVAGSGDIRGVGPLYLFLGGATGPSTVPLWTYPGLTGWTLTMADVDADGIKELVVPSYELQDELASGALIVLNDLANAAGPMLLSTTPLNFDIGEGFELGTLDDRDGDGAEDVVVGWQGRVDEIPWTVGFDLSGSADVWRGDGGAIASLRTTDVDGGGRDLSVSWFYYSGLVDPHLTVWLTPPIVPPTTTTTATTTTTTTTTPPTPTASDPTHDTGGQSELNDGCGCSQASPLSGGWLLISLAGLCVRRRQVHPTPRS